MSTTITAELPVTGVFNTNALECIHETIDNQSDDPDYHNALTEARSQAELDNHPIDDQTFAECYEQQTAYIGMKENEDGQWEPDKEHHLGYSAIARLGSYSGSGVIQVIWSRWGILCNACSPCYPGQGDGDTPGTLLAYSVPPDTVGHDYDPETGEKEEGDRAEMRGRIFELPKE